MANKELRTLRDVRKALEEDPNIAVLFRHDGKAVKVPLHRDELPPPIQAIIFENAVFAASGAENRVFTYECGQGPFLTLRAGAERPSGEELAKMIVGWFEKYAPMVKALQDLEEVARKYPAKMKALHDATGVVIEQAAKVA